MSEPILTFNAKSVSCENLEKTLIGRKETVDQLFLELHEKLIKKETYQSLLVAVRGSGKTHLTKVIYCRLKKSKDLNDKMVVAYMIEDEYGIGNFIHLCIQILNAFVRYKELDSEHIHDAITQIAELPSNNQEAAIKNLLLNFIKDRGLVVLIENLDTVFKGMGKKEVAKLRDFMHEHNQISLVSTAQSLTKSFSDSQYPFYQFFKTRHLEKLNFEQSFEMIKALASLEYDEKIRKPLLEALNNDDETKAKIRAIYELTYGNHRLIVHFFGFFKANIKSDLSKVFIKQMNDLKSYYEQFAKQLPVQQQRIVQMLSLSRQPMKGLDISKKAFIAQNVVTKLLSELYKKGFIDKSKSGKEVFYELQEPLMRICFEINENPDGIAKLFVDFLKVIYDQKHLKKQYLSYKYGAKYQVEELRPKYNSEAVMYSMALGKPNLTLDPKIQKELESCSKEELPKKIESLLKQENIDNIKRTILYLESNNFEEALTYAKKWLNEEPESVLANLANGSIYHELDDYNKAIFHYKNAIKLNPKNADTHFFLGTALTDKGDFNIALKHLKNAIKLNPKNDIFYNAMGITFSKKGDFDNAIKSYKKGIKLNPKYANAYFNLGDVFDKKGKFNDAISSYKKGIALNPNDSLAYFNLGFTFYKKGDVDNAIIQYKKAIELKPKDSDAYFILGLIFDEKGDFDNAIIHFKNTIDLKPKNANTYNCLGNAFRKKGDVDNAIIQYKKAIELNPKDADAYNNWGILFDQKGDVENAIIKYKKAIELNPKDAKVYFNLGIMLSEEEDFDNAIIYIKKAIELNPKHTDAYYNLGIAFRKKGDIDNAIAQYKKAIELNPKHAKAYNHLGISFWKKGDFEQSILHFKKAIQLDKKNTNSYFSLIYLYMVQGDDKQVQKQIQKILRLEKEEDSSKLINEDILIPLIKHNTFSFIQKQIPSIFKQFKKAKRQDEFLDAFPTTIFELLIHAEDYEKERLVFVEQFLVDTFQSEDKMKIPLLMLRVGIQYLKDNDQRALFQLSKEERKVFHDFVLEPRKQEKKS